PDEMSTDLGQLTSDLVRRLAVPASFGAGAEQVGIDLNDEVAVDSDVVRLRVGDRLEENRSNRIGVVDQRCGESLAVVSPTGKELPGQHILGVRLFQVETLLPALGSC